jgi:hypothetical protein
MMLPMCVRFHLSPGVRGSLARDGKSVLIQVGSKPGWWLRSDAGEVWPLLEHLYDQVSGNMSFDEVLANPRRVAGPGRRRYSRIVLDLGHVGFVVHIHRESSGLQVLHPLLAALARRGLVNRHDFLRRSLRRGFADARGQYTQPNSQQTDGDEQFRSQHEFSRPNDT